jgi:hypothetical protein
MERDNDYNFVERREALSVVCTALLLHCLTDDDLRSSDWLPVKPFSKPAKTLVFTANGWLASYDVPKARSHCIR